MKTLSIFFALFAGFQFSQAAVLTVNNNNPSPGQFTTLEAAVNAATAGDTIYIHGSPNPYQLSELVKQLTFIGTGFNPQNANNTRSILNQFIIGSFSGTAAAGLPASGSRFEGLTISNMIIPNSPQISGLVFKRCALHPAISVSGSNWVFDECVFGPVISSGVGGEVTFLNNPSNTTFQNCLFVYTTAATGFQGESLHTLFLNNNFIRAGATTNAMMQTNGIWSQAIIEGNIFLNTNPNLNCSNCTFTRNISFSPQGTTLNDLNSVPGSSLNQITNPLFVAMPLNNLTSAPFWNIVQTAGFNPILQVGSPGLTMGPGNTQIGMYGSVTPGKAFVNTGEPDIPVVRTLQLQSQVVPAGSSIDVEFTATPNN